jgi:hypothetical protein
MKWEIWILAEKSDHAFKRWNKPPYPQWGFYLGNKIATLLHCPNHSTKLIEEDLKVECGYCKELAPRELVEHILSLHKLSRL